MKMFVNSSTIYLHRTFIDFRKSINGLSVIIAADMELPVMSGALFIFCNKSQDKLKILYWDNTGFALWYKRLEQDKFKWPRATLGGCMKLTNQQLTWLLSGHNIIGHQSIKSLRILN
jgi:transposase